jgi:pimeloyl-ACP methyl ester carboxylesterase
MRVHWSVSTRRRIPAPIAALRWHDHRVPVASVSSDVQIAYETFGSPRDPAVLLVMGFGAQMIAWHEGLCQMLAEQGRHVIRYDNRDCGLSTTWEQHPVDLMAFIGAVSGGDIPTAQKMIPYTLSDMADDGINLLTALEIEHAHVVGASMGGMIAQRMAIEHPSRIRTLTSMMSSTGEREVGQSTPQAQQVLFTPRPADRDGYISAAERELVWASRRYPDAEGLRRLAASSYDRAYYPAGIPRQLGAMVLDGSRAAGLAQLQVPTLVVHGLDDTLIDPSGGRRTAELIPGAKLMLVPDMGHDRPRSLWVDLVTAIADHTQEADLTGSSRIAN